MTWLRLVSLGRQLKGQLRHLWSRGRRMDLTAQSAYELWERRGRSLGSPEVDWFAAEKALASSTSGDKKTKLAQGNRSTRSHSAV